MIPLTVATIGALALMDYFEQRNALRAAGACFAVALPGMLSWVVFAFKMIG